MKASTGQELSDARGPAGGSVVMYQSWRNLLFLHWKCEPQAIQDLLPEGLKVDTFDGDAYIGLVPFYMCGVRGRFMTPFPGTANFLEMNVRTYVRDTHDRAHPGVWFFSLDANCRPAVWAARTFFHLPYFKANMSATKFDDGWVDYRCLRKAEGAPDSRFRYRGVPGLISQEAEPDTLEFFLLERYWLYAFNEKRKRLLTGQVKHSPYRFRAAEVEKLDSRPVELGPGLSQLRAPDHQCVAEDVNVSILGFPKHV